MKRSWAVVGVLLLGSLIGAPLAVSASPMPGVRASVQDFSFESYTADYYLSRDAGGNATMRTVESFVAVFPQEDQNRGMIRAIPDNYDGVPLESSIESVTDQNGNPVPFEQIDQGGFIELALGDDEYVHGRTNYTVTYTQRNVVRSFASTDSDEFYWDAQGVGFPQRFGTVTMRVHVDPEIAAFLTGHVACYRGPQGATDQCELTRSTEDAGELFTASERDIAGFETVSVAIGFTKGTFIQVEPEDNSGPRPGDPDFPAYPGEPQQQAEAPWWAGVGSIVAGILAALGSVFAVVTSARQPKSAKGRGIIIPQYTVPKDLNLLEAGELVRRTGHSVAAQIVSFAVRGKVRILDYPVTDSGAQYTVQLLDPTGLDTNEHQLLSALFAPQGGMLEPGAVREVGVTDDTVATAVDRARSAATARVRERGFTLKRSIGGNVGIAVGLFVLSFVAMGFFLVSALNGRFDPLGLIAFFLAFVGIFIAAFSGARAAPLTEAGAERRDYLLGMRDYLQLAEAERFRMLQSPEGAERVRAEGFDLSEPAQRVKLYEKLLPFAVLWGVEKEWAKELTILYDTEAPEWFVSSSGFDAAIFASALSTFSSTAVANPSVSTSSDSSWSGSGGGSFTGGSFGGGFSGGGGGGGGGGGR